MEGDPDSFKEGVIRYYLRQGLPLLALIENQSNAEAQESYAFERYKLGGQVDPSMERTVAGLDDKIALARCLLAANKLPQLLDFLRAIREEFAEAAGAVSLSVVTHTKKHALGELMRLGFQTEQLLAMLKERGALLGQLAQEFQVALKQLRQLVTMSKVVASLLLHDYSDLLALLDGIGPRSQDPEDSAEFWSRAKAGYEGFHEARKEKSVKQMDHFEHAFIGVRRQGEEEGGVRSEMGVTREEAAVAVVRLLVLRFFLKAELPLREQVEAGRRELSHTLKHWIPHDSLHDIHLEFRTLIREGSQAKIKLALLRSVFEDHFVNVYDIVALTHEGYF